MPSVFWRGFPLDDAMAAVPSDLNRCRPIAVDLFAGAGGMTLGFEMAGFAVPVAVELDPIHCRVHEYNFPQTRVLCRSVAAVTAAEIRQAIAAGYPLEASPESGQESGQDLDPNPEPDIDVLFGGPPCQGFSTIGKRSLDDPRNGLVFHFLRLVFDLRPKYFVMENVRGMTLGKHRGFLEELIETARSRGYGVCLPYRVLNAAHYGVPQDRDRLFLLGVRQDCPWPTYPAPRTRFPDGHRRRPGRPPQGDDPLPSAPTVWEAIADLPNVDAVAPLAGLLQGDRLDTPTYGTPQGDYGRRCRGLTRSPDDWSHPRQVTTPGLSGCGLTHHSPRSRDRFLNTPPGTVEPISRFRRLDPHGLCNTLRAGTPSSRGAFTSPRPIHPHQPRCITIREAARLHGYPDWFSFHSTKWHGMRQIGNSVPPPLAQAVAAELYALLRNGPPSAPKPLVLGAIDGLQCTMGAAADHYQVDPHTIAPRRRHPADSPPAARR